MRRLSCTMVLVALAASGGFAAATAQQREVTRSSLPPALRTALNRGSLRVVGPAQPTAVAPQTQQLPLSRQRMLAARIADAPRTEIRAGGLGMVGGRAADTVTVLPYYYLGVAGNGATMHLRPLVYTERPLRYDAAQGGFRGSVMVLLEDSTAPERRQDLAATVAMAVATPQVDSVAPMDLELTHTNLPAARITVFGKAPRDSVSIRLVPAFDPAGVTVWVPVRPTLVLQTGPARAAGLGLKTVPVTVMLQGKSLGAGDSLAVTLTTDRGTLVHNQVVIGKGGTAVAELRSAGIGMARISAFGPGVDGAEGSIQFTWPIAFLLAALLGGGIGGATKQVSKGWRKFSTVLRHAFTGMLIGFAVAVVYYGAQLNLLAAKLDLAYSDEAAIFALALLGGLFGIAGLGKLPAARKMLHGSAAPG